MDDIVAVTHEWLRTSVRLVQLGLVLGSLHPHGAVLLLTRVDYGNRDVTGEVVLGVCLCGARVGVKIWKITTAKIKIINSLERPIELATVIVELMTNF